MHEKTVSGRSILLATRIHFGKVGEEYIAGQPLCHYYSNDRVDSESVRLEGYCLPSCQTALFSANTLCIADDRGHTLVHIDAHINVNID